jgi:hypothetical protein
VRSEERKRVNCVFRSAEISDKEQKASCFVIEDNNQKKKEGKKR